MIASILDLICKWNFDFSVSLTSSIWNLMTLTRETVTPKHQNTVRVVPEHLFE
jgi:hypothetical protein